MRQKKNIIYAPVICIFTAIRMEYTATAYNVVGVFVRVIYIVPLIVIDIDFGWQHTNSPHHMYIAKR